MLKTTKQNFLKNLNLIRFSYSILIIINWYINLNFKNLSQMTPDELNQRPEVKYKTLKNQQEVTFSIFFYDTFRQTV